MEAHATVMDFGAAAAFAPPDVAPPHAAMAPAERSASAPAMAARLSRSVICVFSTLRVAVLMAAPRFIISDPAPQPVCTLRHMVSWSLDKQLDRTLGLHSVKACLQAVEEASKSVMTVQDAIVGA